MSALGGGVRAAAPASPATARTMHPTAIECSLVSKQYDLRPVLREVSLQVAPGERLALTGPSGSGKTTLLNCLGGIDRPDSGEILIGGEPITRMQGSEMADLRRRKLGNIFQFFHLLPTLSVRENVEFPLVLLGVTAPERARRAQALLERVNVGHRAEAFPAQLSGGEMQRAAIARSLVTRPEILLADEPTGNLDARTGRGIIDLIAKLNAQEQLTIIMVTHDQAIAAEAHRTVRLCEGRIEALGDAVERGSPKIRLE